MKSTKIYSFVEDRLKPNTIPKKTTYAFTSCKYYFGLDIVN